MYTSTVHAGAVALAKALTLAPRLQTLDLSQCGVSSPGAVALAEALQQKVSLQARPLMRSSTIRATDAFRLGVMRCTVLPFTVCKGEKLKLGELCIHDSEGVPGSLYSLAPLAELKLQSAARELSSKGSGLLMIASELHCAGLAVTRQPH